jgi:transposase
MKNKSKERERFWQAHVSAWRRSGLSQREYCNRQGLGEWSFSSWKRRLAKRQVDVVGFLPVAVRNQAVADRAVFPNGCRHPLALVIGDRYRVEVGDGFSSETLTRLLAVLRGR